MGEEVLADHHVLVGLVLVVLLVQRELGIVEVVRQVPGTVAVVLQVLEIVVDVRQVLGIVVVVRQVLGIVVVVLQVHVQPEPGIVEVVPLAFVPSVAVDILDQVCKQVGQELNQELLRDGVLAYVVVDMLELPVEHFRSKDILEAQHPCST